MSYIVVDVESDGEIPFKYSMVCFGAVIVEPTLSKTFYGKTKPISENWKPEALAISGFSREQHLKFDDPKQVMENFAKWIEKNSIGKPTFISDNLAFDWQWINWYFHNYIGSNPFGFSGRRIGDLYCGMKMNCGLNSEWKKLYRKTTHDHNPVNDAKGNAEAVIQLHKMGLRIPYLPPFSFSDEKNKVLNMIDLLMEEYEKFTKTVSPKNWRTIGLHFTELRKIRYDIVNFSELTEKENEWVRKQI